MTSISINFTGQATTSMASTETAGVVVKTNWNNALGAKSSALALVDDTGAATPAKVSWAADNTWNTPIPDTAGNNRMMRGYLDSSSGNPVVVSVSGLPAGKYDIYVYTDGDNAGYSHAAAYSLSGTGITPVSVMAVDVPNMNFGGTFTRANNSAGNYILFSGIAVTSDFTITATPGATDNVPRAAVNAIQIIPVAPIALTLKAPTAISVKLPATANIPLTVQFPKAGTYTATITMVGAADVKTIITVSPADVISSTLPTSGDVIYPPNSGVLNVKNFGAKGDGVTDDTASIRNAMYTGWATGANVVYFPSGTYLITDTLMWRDQGGIWRAWLTFQGQNKTTTRIKLKDGSPGFQNTAGSPMYDGAPINARAMLYLASNQESNNLGAGEAAYANCIFDLTIDTGNGNPGAQAIDWCCSNNAALRNLELTGASGRAGLNASRGIYGAGNGPALVKNLTVSGVFDFGVINGSGEVCITYEHIKIGKCNITDFWNRNQNVHIRGLDCGTVVNEGNGNMTLIDSPLPVVTNNSPAWLFRRDSGREVETGGAALSLFPPAKASLNLAIKETPEPYFDNDFTHWAVVSDYGATPNGQDCTAAILKAFASGKPIIFFPAGAYTISGTLHVPASVKRILGVWSNFTSSGGAVLQFDGVVQDFRMFSFAGPVSVIDNTSQSLTLADMYNLCGYTNVSGNNAYIEDAAINNTFTLHGGTIYARQLDIECEVPHIVNDGGTLWVLGYKTEGANALGLFTRGAVTEILGAFNSTPGPGTYLGYFTTDSQTSIAGLSSGSERVTVLTETRSGTEKTQNNIGNRYGGTAVTLYSGR